jgi:hypothetical protein
MCILCKINLVFVRVSVSLLRTCLMHEAITEASRCQIIEEMYDATSFDFLFFRFCNE